MPVLNERMIASALLLAGAMGANISRVVAVIAFFWACISFKSFFLRRDISSNVNFLSLIHISLTLSVPFGLISAIIPLSTAPGNTNPPL